MDGFIYTAMNGARQLLMKQATNNHNIANLNTIGYRADTDAFRSLPLYGPGHPSRVYPQDHRAGVDFNPGPMLTTGNDLDVAIRGPGFIAVLGADGEEAYTRNGELRLNALGMLETANGWPVVGEGGAIAVPPHAKLQIGADGTVSIQPLGQDANTLAVVDRIKLVNPDVSQLKKDLQGLLRLPNGETAEPDAKVTLVNGTLEASNVNPVGALVEMIETARRFELNVQLMKAAEQNDASSAELMKVG